jgi:hypothetical protein
VHFRLQRGAAIAGNAVLCKRCRIAHRFFLRLNTVHQKIPILAMQSVEYLRATGACLAESTCFVWCFPNRNPGIKCNHPGLKGRNGLPPY